MNTKDERSLFQSSSRLARINPSPVAIKPTIIEGQNFNLEFKSNIALAKPNSPTQL